MVSVLNKEPKYKVEKLKYTKLEVVQPRINNKTILNQSTRSFTVEID